MSEPKRLRMLEEWNKFSAAVATQMSPNQKTDMRRAFYGGAWAMYCTMMSGVTPGPDTTPADEKLITEIVEEIRAFFVDVKAGRA